MPRASAASTRSGCRTEASVAADFARLHGDRLHTLTLSGNPSHERDAVLDVSGPVAALLPRPELFDLYTRYLYEKIFGEAFVSRVGEKLESMRSNFHDRYWDRIEARTSHRGRTRSSPGWSECKLLRGDPVPGARPRGVPEDRAIPPSQQRKIAAVIPHARYEEIEGAGHVVYLRAARPLLAAGEAFFGPEGLGEPEPLPRARARDGGAADASPGSFSIP